MPEPAGARADAALRECFCGRHLSPLVGRLRHDCGRPVRGPERL